MNQAPSHGVKCLKADGRHSVWLIRQPAESNARASPRFRVLKRWPADPWTVFKLVLGIAQPQRQMRGIRLLRHMGIHTPQCFGSWRLRRVAGQPLIELELEYAPGVSAWELVCRPNAPVENQDALIQAAQILGSIVAHLANGGIFHRDLKLSNIIINLDTRPPEVSLIDTVGVRRMRNRPMEIVRMLDRLAVQPMTVPDALQRRLRQAVLHAALRPLQRQLRMEVCLLMRDAVGRAQPHSAPASTAM